MIVVYLCVYGVVSHRRQFGKRSCRHLGRGEPSCLITVENSPITASWPTCRTRSKWNRTWLSNSTPVNPGANSIQKRPLEKSSGLFLWKVLWGSLEALRASPDLRGAHTPFFWKGVFASDTEPPPFGLIKGKGPYAARSRTIIRRWLGNVKASEYDPKQTCQCPL